MALEKANRTGNAAPFKFEKRGDSLKGYYVKTEAVTINGSAVKQHLFKTATGFVSVLGQADMYKQLVDNNCVNNYVEITFSGEVQKLKGGKTMKLYDVAFDRADTLDNSVSTPVDEDVYVDEEEPADEIEVARATPPARAAAAPDAARKARTEALLSGGRK